jgi:hypothetical protein
VTEITTNSTQDLPEPTIHDLFNQDMRSSLTSYVQAEVERLALAARTARLILDAEPATETEYELPSEYFLQLVTYIECLSAYRAKYFSFATGAGFKEGKSDQQEFEKRLAEVVEVMADADSLLANLNDAGFLSAAHYLIERGFDEVNAHVKRHDMFGDNPEFSNHRLLRKRLYNVLSGDGTRISDLMRSSEFSLTIIPYHVNLDKACQAIATSLRGIEPELNKRGFMIDSKLYYILSEGPEHEKAHQEAYINYRPENAQGRRALLREGHSRLSEWVNYGVDLQIVRQGNVIKAGMVTGIPSMITLDEIITVYLAPKHPSLGDVLYTISEIFSYMKPEAPLYGEVLQELADICEELRLFTDMENPREHLVERMKDINYGKLFIDNFLTPKLKHLEDSIPEYFARIIRSHKNEYARK